jgi:hypothetical protein
VFLCKLEDNGIFGLLLEHIAETQDFVAELLGVGRSDLKEKLERARRQLPSR